MIEQSGEHMSSKKGTRLAGKVAIVTGGGSASSLLGIGAAIALLFADQGAHVGIIDLVSEHAERTCLAIKEAGGEAIAVQADVSNADTCKAAIETVAAHFGQLDIVVNNAAIAQGGPIGVVSEEVWDRVMDVNLKSVMLTSTFALPYLRSSKQGAIINISSMAAVRASGAGAYAASKGGIIAMTKDMAYSFGSYGIRVNCLVPGHVYAPMGTAGGEEGRDLRRRANLLGKEGTAWDVAWPALFLASEEARWITAAILPVDAGAMSVAPLALLPHLL